MMLEGVGLRVVEADVRKIRRVAVWVERRAHAQTAGQETSEKGPKV
jgi:hypothetical protein